MALIPPKTYRAVRRIKTHRAPKPKFGSTVLFGHKFTPGEGFSVPSPTPTPAAAPVATPPSPPAGPLPLPIDPIYDAAVASAGRTRDDTIAGLLQARGSAALDVGYSPTYDANGFVSALAFDPNNPYSKAALLRDSYKQGLRRNTNSYASQGQLYSGALSNAQDYSTRNFDIADNNLRNSFINFIAKNQAGINGAQGDYLTNVGNADADRVARASQTDTGDSAPLPTPVSPTPAAAAPKLIRRKSAAHGGQMWLYRRGASGKLIPVRKA